MRLDRMALLRRLSLFLAAIGLIVAGYLTYLHLSGSTAALCAQGGGCDTVRTSRYSVVAGIPVAVVGVVGYLAMLAVLLLEEFDGPLADQVPLLMFGFSLIGVLYSVYLTYLELFVIAAICPYCVVSAIIVTLIFIIAIFRLSGDQAEPEN